MEKGRILIVDDDKDILRLLSHLLTAAGYNVATVENSISAYEIIIRFSPDLIILDMMMPSLNGNEVLELLKEGEFTRHISVIFCSAVSASDRILKSLDMGADDYITKPFNPEILLGKVRKAMLRIEQKKLIGDIISRYLGRDVAETIIKEPWKVKIYGARTWIACLFADIRGFSNIAAVMEPEEVVKLLNRVLTELSEAVFSIGGTVDKFLGDGLMAFWGAPIPNDDSEMFAVECALLMQDKIKEFNEHRYYPGGLEIQLGIGISAGEVVVGNIGSDKRADYTAIGESVNIASRLENMAGGGQILITKNVYDKIAGRRECLSIGEVEIKGCLYPMDVYQVYNCFS